MPADGEARVDQWLWAIRLVRSRTDATSLCKAGHVEVNDRPAKAATPVRGGDRVSARIHGRDRVVEVVDPITKRVGAPIAVTCYVDHSPPPPEDDPFAPPTAVRERGAGRPTKRERREIDRFRGA